MDISDEEEVNSEAMEVEHPGSGGGAKGAGRQQQLAFHSKSSPSLPPRAPSSSTTPNAPPSSDLPWVEKYRPTSLDDLIAHEEIISICEYHW